MPKSKVRKKTPYSAPSSLRTGPSAAAGKGVRPSPTWYPIVMVALLVIGLIYIVTYYMAGEKVPVMKDIGAWNFGVGFAFLVSGLGLAVRWK
jgi:hypothetical protein